MLNILIGIPSLDNVPTDFAMSLGNLEKPSGAQTKIFNFRSSNIAYSRDVLANVCVKEGYSHLLFLDSDMQFPSHTLIRLLSHEKDSVICNYSRRFEPPFPTVLPKERNDLDLVEVRGGGMGICLLTAECIKSLDRPRFNMDWNEENKSYNPEDTTFFKAIKENGFATYMDKTLSKEIGHVGQKIYRL